MTVVVVDCGSGNLRSAAKALERAVRELGGSDRVLVSNRADDLLQADRLVLPGVGAFADCHRGLSAPEGLIDALEEMVRVRARPFLGICVGMQLMAERGLEYGSHPGLNWIGGKVIRLSGEGSDGLALKVPHMGWNEIHRENGGHPVLENLPEAPHFYFVHSYHFALADKGDCKAYFNYGGSHCAMVARDNMVGVQFHPEKSQAAGLRLLSNFLTWTP